LVDTTPLLKENQALYATQWSRLLADQLTVQRDGAVKNYLREFEMLSNLTALLINNPSKELAVLRETSLGQYQVIFDNLMTDSYIVENHGAEVTIFLYQAARLGQATGDESLMVYRVEQMETLATSSGTRACFHLRKRDHIGAPRLMSILTTQLSSRGR
jgi:hypothetical protein